MPKEVVSIEFGLLHQYSGSNKILVVIMQLMVQERVVWLPSSNCQRKPSQEKICHAEFVHLKPFFRRIPVYLCATLTRVETGDAQLTM